MSTLAKPEVRDRCCARLERLDADAGRKWGRMTARQMICHLNDSFRVAAGERQVSMAPSPLPRGLVKWLALRTPLPWARNIPTRPEIEQGRGGTPPGDWEKDRRNLRQWIVSFPERQKFGTHPMFGLMSWNDWQIWAYRHVDHHLRQFGA